MRLQFLSSAKLFGVPMLFLCLVTLPHLAVSQGALLPATPNHQLLPDQKTPPYVLHSGDDLEMSFFYNPELNQHTTVRPDGRISMPLLGELQASGLTIQQLTDELQAAYASELKRAGLSIQLRASPNQVYYVGGEVSRPGVLPLRGTPVTALQAVIEAGGLRESAVRVEATVLRKSPAGGVEVHRLGMKAKRGEAAESASFILQPLDVLLVGESRINKMDRAMEQYVKRLAPVLLTGGFTYLFGSTTPF